MGAQVNGSRIYIHREKVRANHQARRRSSRIALRDRKDYEEVEVLDDVKVKATV